MFQRQTVPHFGLGGEPFESIQSVVVDGSVLVRASSDRRFGKHDKSHPLGNVRSIAILQVGSSEAYVYFLDHLNATNGSRVAGRQRLRFADGR